MRLICHINTKLTLVLALTLSFPLSLIGCTVVTIKNADLVKTTLYPGVVMLRIVDVRNNVAINSKGVGAQLNNQGAVFGYFQEQSVYMNDLSRCVTIFFNEQATAFEKSSTRF